MYAHLMARRYTHNISFRVTAAELGRMQALRASFPDQQWGEAIRWLFEQPEVGELIKERAGGEVAAGRMGIENSLPIGDR